jgi:hypothetical protein
MKLNVVVSAHNCTGNDCISIIILRQRLQSLSKVDDTRRLAKGDVHAGGGKVFEFGKMVFISAAVSAPDQSHWYPKGDIALFVSFPAMCLL